MPESPLSLCHINAFQANELVPSLHVGSVKKCIINLSIVLLGGVHPVCVCVCACGSITGMQDPPPLETGGASSPSDVMTAASAVSSALSLFAADRFLLKGNI